MFKRTFPLDSVRKMKAVLNCVVFSPERTNNKCTLKLPAKNFVTFHSQQNKKYISNRVSVNFFHTSQAKFNKGESEKMLLKSFPPFEKAEKKNKETFLQMIKLYKANFPKGKATSDFIKIAMKHMEEYGVNEDIEVYKKLIDLYPRGVYVAKTGIMIDMMYHPKEQFTTMDLLRKLEWNGIIPDRELLEMLKAIFGDWAHPTTKYKRYLYWTGKFKNRMPWVVPRPVPNDPLELAKIAIERITSVDLQTEISVFQTRDVPEAIDDTWIVSAQSPKQKELLKNHLPDAPVVVEGGDIVWLRDKTVKYFILKADCDPFPYVPPKDSDDVSQMESRYFNPDYKEEKEPLSVHEQDDGIIYGVCATGHSSKDSLLSWVRLLQKNGNPNLEKVPVLFRLRSEEKLPATFSDEVVTTN